MNIVNGNKWFMRTGVEIGCIIVAQKENETDLQYVYVSRELHVDFEYSLIDLSNGYVFNSLKDIYDLSIGSDIGQGYDIMDIFYPNEIELKLKIR